MLPLSQHPATGWLAGWLAGKGPTESVPSQPSRAVSTWNWASTPGEAAGTRHPCLFPVLPLLINGFPGAAATWIWAMQTSCRQASHFSGLACSLKHGSRLGMELCGKACSRVLPSINRSSINCLCTLTFPLGRCPTVPP